MVRAPRALPARVLTHAVRAGIAAAVAAAMASPLGAQAQGEDPWADPASPLHSITWMDGGTRAEVGNRAELTVPAPCRYADAKGARDFLQMTQNVPSGRELGILVCRGIAAGEQPWFVVFSFESVGYVRDDEKDHLDSVRILDAVRRGTEQDNRRRRAQGWEELTIEGWARAPYYDPGTHNLTWSIRGSAPSSGTSINHSVRLLGRRGVLHADLVASPEQIPTTVAVFDSVIATTSFRSGERYSEWRKGDRVAAYGLTALIAGGTGVAVIKLGIMAKLTKVFAKLIAKVGKVFVLLLAKAGKLIILLVVGLLAGLKSLFTRKKTATA